MPGRRFRHLLRAFPEQHNSITPAEQKRNDPGEGGHHQYRKLGNAVHRVSHRAHNVNEQIVRIDHQFSDKTSLMFHYIRNGINQNFPTTLWSSDSYPTVGTDFLNEPQAVMLKLTRSISPTLLNEAMIGWSRQPLTLLPTGNYQRPSGLTISELFPGNADNRIPVLSFAAPLNTAFDLASWPWTNVYQNWQIRDSVSKISGNHSFNFGA